MLARVGSGDLVGDDPELCDLFSSEGENLPVGEGRGLCDWLSPAPYEDAELCDLFRTDGDNLPTGLCDWLRTEGDSLPTGEETGLYDWFSTDGLSLPRVTVGL